MDTFRFRMARRALAAIGVSTAVAIAVAGCGTGPGSGASGPVTITVQQAAGWGDMVGVLKQRFEAAHPDIKLNFVIITDEQKSSTNTQVISGSNPPDLALVPTNSPVYTATMAAKQLEPLDDVWKSQDLEKRYGASTAASLTASDGKRYVATIDSIFYNVVFANTDLLQQVGVTIPADHRIPDNKTLFDIAAKLKSKGLQALAFNGKEPGRYGWMVDQLLESSATPEQMKNYLTSFDKDVPVTATYTDPAFVAAVQQVKDWADNGVFQTGYLGQDDPTAESLFLQGKAAMYLGGNFSVADIKKAGLHFSWLLLPPVDGGKKVAIPSYHGESMAIPANAKHKDAAKKFLEFWLTDEGQADAVANTGFALPAVNTVDIKSLTGVDPIVSELIGDVSENGAPVGWTSAVPGEFGQTTIGTNLQQVLTGKLTVDDVAQAQQAALDKFRQSN